MIRPVTEKDIPACVEVIRKSFLTVAEEFHFTKENAPRFTAFSVDEDRLSSTFTLSTALCTHMWTAIRSSAIALFFWREIMPAN